MNVVMFIESYLFFGQSIRRHIDAQKLSISSAWLSAKLLADRMLSKRRTRLHR